MRWVDNKSFQRPVLFESVSPDLRDYVRKSFQAIPEFRLVGEKPVLELQFALREETLQALIDAKKAVFAVEIYCPTTFLRELRKCSGSDLSMTFPEGALHERVEISTYVVCSSDVPGHTSPNFHPEFGKGASFDFQKGDVMAVGKPIDYWWDQELRRPISSVFELAEGESDPSLFTLSFDSEKVQIVMSQKDKERFNLMRSQPFLKPFLLASVYLAALTEALSVMSSEDGSAAYEGKKWFQAIRYKLSEKGLDLDGNDPHYVLAQRLLELPLEKLFRAGKEATWNRS